MCSCQDPKHDFSLCIIYFMKKFKLHIKNHHFLTHPMANMCGINLELAWGMDVHEKKFKLLNHMDSMSKWHQDHGVLARIRSSLT